ncbi:MAG: GspH/FimT family protein [Deltaproteobacteria bacterium]|nr:GspH/FimT family protein [Deltaproteobacteria bacterium]
MRARAGVTLVELAAVLAVVGVLAAVAVPYLLGTLPAFRVNAAARQLVGDFRLARTLAVDRNTDVLIQFHAPTANDYTLALDTYPPPGGDHHITAEDEPVKVVRVAALYEGIEFTPSPGGGPPADGVTFTNDLANFNPDGHGVSGTVYVRPAADAGRTRSRERRVTVDGSTGRARIQRWTGSEWE